MIARLVDQIYSYCKFYYSWTREITVWIFMRILSHHPCFIILLWILILFIYITFTYNFIPDEPAPKQAEVQITKTATSATTTTTTMTTMTTTTTRTIPTSPTPATTEQTTKHQNPVSYGRKFILAFFRFILSTPMSYFHKAYLTLPLYEAQESQREKMVCLHTILETGKDTFNLEKRLFYFFRNVEIQ